MRKRNHRSTWTLMRIYPPVACRLLARTSARHPRPLTDEEIAEKSQLPLTTVQAMETLTSWDSVTISTMRRFAEACGMDFCNRDQMRRATQYATKRLLARLHYLRKDREWDSRWSRLKAVWDTSLRQT